MTEPVELSRTVQYRVYSLVISKPAKQWHVFVLPPETTASRDGVALIKGWQEDEVLGRARFPGDDFLALHHPR